MSDPMNNDLPAGHRVFPLLERRGIKSPKPLANGQQFPFNPRSERSTGVNIAELACLSVDECCQHLAFGYTSLLSTGIVVRMFDPYYESKKFEIPDPLPGGSHSIGALGFLIAREYAHFWHAENGYAKSLLDDVYLYQLRELDDGTWKAVVGGSPHVLSATSQCRGLLRGV